jgi:hypothetical protein
VPFDGPLTGQHAGIRAFHPKFNLVTRRGAVETARCITP